MIETFTVKGLSNSFQKRLLADVLQNRRSKKFRNIHRKTLVLESVFNKVAGLKAYNFIKKRLQHRCFPVDIAEFLRTSFFKEYLRWLVLSFKFKLHEFRARR